MKQYYLDEVAVGKKDAMTSYKWYSMQATRATNQAIGRVIRHKEDYGNIILVDKRFAETYNKESISKWLKDQVIEYDDFETALQDYADFFSEMQQRNFVAKVDKLEKIKLEFNELDEDPYFKNIKDKIQEDAENQKELKLRKAKVTKKSKTSEDIKTDEESKVLLPVKLDTKSSGK